MQDNQRSYHDLNQLADELTDRLEGVLDSIDGAREFHEVERRKSSCPYSPHLARIDLKLCYHEKMLKWIIGITIGGFSMVVSILLAWMGMR